MNSETRGRILSGRAALYKRNFAMQREVWYPAKFMDKKRILTGIDDLDPLIEEGFLAGKSFLITGEPGTGKSILCMQFILKGLLDGEKAVYVAVGEKPSDIVEDAASQGWDLQYPVTALLSYMDVVGDIKPDGSEPDQLFSLKRIEALSRHLFDLIDHHAQAVRIDAGKLEIHKH